jgi:CRISPR/Cas system-associated protein endoribonuclease Cas2
MKHEYLPLVLTSEYFKILVEQLKNKFLKKNELRKLPKNYQFFGYGNFNESKPSLKKELEDIGSDFVNGKYLYDKMRQLDKGRSIIKINKYYSTLVLVYLEYESSESFVQNQSTEESKKQKQLALSATQDTHSDYYYLNYYFGEFKTIIKGTTVISKNWKKIHHTFQYRNTDGSITEMHSDGTIIKGRDSLHTRCKRIVDNKIYEGDSEIYYVGQNEFSSLNYILGSYCAFNLHTNTVSGRVILEKCASEEDMIQKAAIDSIPPYIAQEIRNQIIETPHSIANTYLEISDKSPYSSIYAKIPGTYEITFNTNLGTNDTLKFQILSTNYRLVSLTPDVYFEKDSIDLLSKGTILGFKFNLSGITSINRVDMYVKTLFLKEGETKQSGVFSGVDNENKLVNGTVDVAFLKAV